jgi:putative peptidoglycan lipid II flippase
MAGIFASRLVGLVRQRVVAHYFGTSAFADVVAAAFRVGNITQNLLGEGTLSASFIPVYARLRAQNRSRDASRFALGALGLLLATVLLVSAAGALAAPALTRVIAAGFDAERQEATVRVVRLAFPMTGLLVLAAWALGVMTSHRKFLAPYAAPVLWSAAQIVAVVVAATWFGARGEALAVWLAWGALAGAALQLLVLLPATRALLGALRPRIDLRDPSLREAVSKLPGALLGRGVIQLSGLVDTLLVSFLGTGANAVLGYAQTLYLLPMALLGTGEAAVALPEMARGTADADVERRHAGLRAQLGAALARIATLTLPTMAAFVVFGGELVTLLLQTGSFDRTATARVEPVLAAYAFALLANASSRVLGTTCYALGDTKTPARFAFFRVLVSTAVALVLMRSLGVLGVVLGAVLAAWVEVALLGSRVARTIGGLGLSQLRPARLLLATLLPVLAAVAMRHVLPREFAASPLGAALLLTTFGALFLAVAPALGLLRLRSLLRRR